MCNPQPFVRAVSTGATCKPLPDTPISTTTSPHRLPLCSHSLSSTSLLETPPELSYCRDTYLEIPLNAHLQPNNTFRTTTMAAPRSVQFIALRNLSRGTHQVRSLHMTGPATYASPVLTKERPGLNLPHDIAGLRNECKKRKIDFSGNKQEVCLNT